MKRLLVTLGLLLSGPAVAGPYYGYPAAGTLTGSELFLAQQNGNDVTVRLGNLGILGNQGINYYDTSGLLLNNGGVALNKPSFGWQGTATGLSVILDGSQPFPQVNGNYGNNPSTRSLAYAADHVGIYSYAAVQPPILTITTSGFSYANDPASPFEEWIYDNGRNQGECPGSFGTWYNLVTNPTTGMLEPPCPTRTQATGTLLNFSPPLSASVVAQLRVNMLVETRDNYMMSAITSWDPGGAWIRVDTWSLLLTGSQVQNGYNPTTLGTPPNNGQTIDINPMHGVYEENGGVTIPATPYINPETSVPGNAILAERYLANMWGAPTESEFNSNQDSPIANGFDLGCSGTYGCGSAFRLGGAFYRGVDCYNGYPTYACVVAEPVSNGTQTPGAVVIDQRAGGTSYQIKTSAGVTHYLLDRIAGAQTRANQPTHAVWQGVLYEAGGANSGVLTEDGNAPTAANTPPAVTAGYSYTVEALIQCSDHSQNSATWHVHSNFTYAASSTTSFNVQQTGLTVLTYNGTNAWTVTNPSSGSSITPIIGGTSGSCTADVRIVAAY